MTTTISTKSARLGALVALGFGPAAHTAPLLPASGLRAPDYAINAAGDNSRLYVVKQRGLLRVIENNVLLATPALDISARVSPPLNAANTNDGRGFLGLVFYPDFNPAGSAGFRTFYTYSSEPIAANTAPTFAAPNGALQNYKNVVSEWKMSSTEPGQVDLLSRREVMSFGKNAGNHNGSTIAFGPDCALYLGLGDGGNASDAGASHNELGGNAKNVATPLGKMLRLDPLAPALTAASGNTISANGQYRIPTDNPFQAAGQVPETYALGFRNPYRWPSIRSTAV